MSKTKRNYHPIRRVLFAMTFLAIAFPVGSFVLLGLSYSGQPVVADDPRPVVAERQQAKADRNQRIRPSRRNGGLGGLGGMRVESKVAKAVREIQALADDDESKTEKTETLRELLNQEFAKMHDKQAEEMSKTQERLDKLKKTHQSRGDNQDKIVQRRIDQLLGEPDDLAWIEDDSSTPSGGLGRSRARFHPPPSRRSSSRTSFGLGSIDDGSADAPSLGEIFQLAREAGIAINNLKIAKEDFGRMMQSRSKESGPRFLSEIQKAKSHFEKLRLVERSYRQQIEAVNRRLEQAVKHVKESLERAEEILKTISLQYEAGKTTREKVLQANQEVSRLKHELEDAKLELQQLRDATATFEKSVEGGLDDLFGGDSSSKKDPFGGESSSDDDPFDSRDPFAE